MVLWTLVSTFSFTKWVILTLTYFVLDSSTGIEPHSKNLAETTLWQKLKFLPELGLGWTNKDTQGYCSLSASTSTRSSLAWATKSPLMVMKQRRVCKLTEFTCIDHRCVLVWCRRARWCVWSRTCHGPSTPRRMTGWVNCTLCWTATCTRSSGPVYDCGLSTYSPQSYRRTSKHSPLGQGLFNKRARC